MAYTISTLLGCSLAALLFAVGGARAREFVPYEDSCAAGSYFCANNCSSVMFCISGGNAIEIDECAAGTVCDVAAHACVEGSECVLPPDPDEFLCHDFGFFPNPYDCTRYHLCLQNSSMQADQSNQCPAGTAYDALSTRCSLGLDSRPCTDKPVPVCESPGQVGALVENPNIYYVCVRKDGAFVPQLYRCPSSEVFVGNKCELGRRDDALLLQD